MSVPPSLEFEKPLKQPVQVKAGSNLAVNLKFTGTPAPSIKWFLNKEPLNGSMFTVMRDTTGLANTNPSCRDAGSYRVVAENEAGTAEASFVVEVLGQCSGHF